MCILITVPEEIDGRRYLFRDHIICAWILGTCKTVIRIFHDGNMILRKICETAFYLFRVLLLGAGRHGSPAALYLAAAGVGTLGIVDFDAVDLVAELIDDVLGIAHQKPLQSSRTVDLGEQLGDVMAS